VVDFEGEFEGVNFRGEEGFEEWCEGRERGGDNAEGDLDYGPGDQGGCVDL